MSDESFGDLLFIMFLIILAVYFVVKFLKIKKPFKMLGSEKINRLIEEKGKEKYIVYKRRSTFLFIEFQYYTKNINTGEEFLFTDNSGSPAWPSELDLFINDSRFDEKFHEFSNWLEKQ